MEISLAKIVDHSSNDNTECQPPFKLPFTLALRTHIIESWMSGRTMDVKKIVRQHGKKYSDLLGINLRGGKDQEIFKWFIASILLGARIGETLALRTYQEFEAEGLLSFDRMKTATWEKLVQVLDDGGYVRYDFSTARNLQAVMKLLGEKYKGKLNNLHAQAKTPADLEARLQEFKSVGPVTANIFLRELRSVWKKSDPSLGHLARKAAKELSIKDPRSFWNKNKIRGYDFINFETALMRLGREARRRRCRAPSLL
jgi:hypothetical protein